MKKIISLTFAVVSTTFLLVGATQAAEKFDGLARSAVPSIAGMRSEGPTMPCTSDPGQDPQQDPEQPEQNQNPE